MVRKFPFVSLCVCLMGVAILCALGAWQIQRLDWKNGLQAELDREFAKDASQTQLSRADFEQDQMRRGFVVAQVDFSKSILLHGRVADGRSIQSVVAPLIVDNTTTLAAEVACTGKNDITELRKISLSKPMRFTGVVRYPHASYWAPANTPAKDDWWRVDTRQLAERWGVANVFPAVFTVESAAPNVALGLFPCPVERTLRNNHASYAIFWFAMAGVLTVMWGLRFLRPYLQSA